jgi:glycosyltransferase involved in cell wall biosynthesis/tetratricopeptide (TPR) repeat protein
MKDSDTGQKESASTAPVLSKLVAAAQESGRRKDWQLALELWDRCLQERNHARYMHWRNEYANALLELDRFKEAGQRFLALICDFPEYAEGYIGLARLATRSCDWELALSQWGRCLQIFDTGDRSWWYVNYARALEALQRFAEAEDIYVRVTAEYPDFYGGYTGLAEMAQKRQDWKEAARLWEICLQRFDANNVWWLTAYVETLLELGQIDQAVVVAEQIACDAQHDAHRLYLLAKVSWLANDMTMCRHYAGRLIEHFPQLQGGYYWSAQALIKLGRFNEAADMHLAWPGGERGLQQIVLPDNYPVQMQLPPLAGRGNDYSFIEEKCKAWRQSGSRLTLPVSIIIPVYNRADMLAKTLAAFVHQTYPQELIEVIVADDGSSDHIAAVIEKYRNYLTLRYVRQEDQGYRVAAVRNLGMKAASHEHIILQDGDVIPAPDLVETYMAFFHVTDQAVLFGLRSYVCTDEYDDDDFLKHPELIRQLPQVNPANSVADWQTVDGRSFDWRLPILAQSDRLKKSIFPCQAFAAGSAAFPGAALQRAGYFDEDFKDWGGEDTEFAYRLYIQGYYFIPTTDVICFHQEPSLAKCEYQVDRQAGLHESRLVLAQKCPLPSIRTAPSSEIWQAPKVSIYIPAYNNGRYIKEAVESVLAQTFTDLEVVICNDGSTDDTLQILETHFSNNPRVHWVSQANQGIGAASNNALRHCRGMYIGQLDGDDMLEPTAVGLLADFLDTHNVGAVYSRFSWMDRNGKFMREIASLEFSREQLVTGMICTHFRMFRKRDWHRTAGFDESMMNAVDYDMMLKLSEVCDIVYLPLLTYKYRFHGENTSLVHREMQERNSLLAINKALTRMGLFPPWQVVPGPASDRRRVKFLQQ